MIGINYLGDKTKVTAVENVIKNMGFKYDFELKKNSEGLYEFVSKQGKIKQFKVFGSYGQYSNWYEDNKEKQKKMFKSWTQYVVLLK